MKIQITPGSGANIEFDDDAAPDGGSIQQVSLANVATIFRKMLLWALNKAQWVEPNSSRVRVVLDATAGAQTLGTVTTVSTVTAVTNVSNLVAVGPASAGIPMRDAMLSPLDRNLAANRVRRLIS